MLTESKPLDEDLIEIRSDGSGKLTIFLHLRNISVSGMGGAFENGDRPPVDSVMVDALQRGQWNPVESSQQPRQVFADHSSSTATLELYLKDGCCGSCVTSEPAVWY